MFLRLPFLHFAKRPREITCPICGNTGSIYGPRPYKSWALAGKDDGGRPLRRCQECKAEIGIHAPWQWWLPQQVWLYSREPEYGKGKRRRRERRAARRQAQGAASGTTTGSGT